QAARTFNVGDMSLGMKYRPHVCSMFLAHASLKRLADRNARGAQVWRWLCEELADAPGLRTIETLPGAIRGGYYSYIFAYEAATRGGASRDEFVAAAQAEGANHGRPLLANQFHLWHAASGAAFYVTVAARHWR